MVNHGNQQRNLLGCGGVVKNTHRTPASEHRTASRPFHPPSAESHLNPFILRFSTALKWEPLPESLQTVACAGEFEQSVFRQERVGSFVGITEIL
jgi:hypothetical protein